MYESTALINFEVLYSIVLTCVDHNAGHKASVPKNTAPQKQVVPVHTNTPTGLLKAREEGARVNVIAPPASLMPVIHTTTLDGRKQLEGPKILYMYVYM